MIGRNGWRYIYIYIYIVREREKEKERRRERERERERVRVSKEFIQPVYLDNYGNDDISSKITRNFVLNSR